MKYILFVLLVFPYACQGQGNAKAGGKPYKEISLNVGYAPDNASKLYGTEWRGGYIRASLRALRNVGRMAYGFGIEGGTSSNDYWYLSPVAIVNRKIPMKRAYFYVGGTGGYVCADDMLKDDFIGKKMGNGYVVGIQAGFVKHLGARVSLSTEVAARWTQIWTRYDRW